jgi:hypothetical protein
MRAESLAPRAEAEAPFMPPEFRGKLEGLYGWGSDEEVYSTLSLDKRAALELLAHRLEELDLWRAVGRIVNVYGVGGVGMYFAATIDLAAELRGRRDFTRKFARHRDNTGGFIEKRRRRASLHFLYLDGAAGGREWHVHLDLYGPMGSFLSAGKHLYYERWRKFRPDWRLMKKFVKHT